MPRTKAKPTQPTNAAAPAGPARAAETAEVLTLAEAAAYLRVPEEEVLHLTGPGGLPARRIGSEWRFLKSALQEWLRTPPKLPSKEGLLAVIGAWKDDPHLDDMLKEIYRQRGRPMTEGGE